MRTGCVRLVEGAVGADPPVHPARWLRPDDPGGRRSAYDECGADGNRRHATLPPTMTRMRTLACAIPVLLVLAACSGEESPRRNSAAASADSGVIVRLDGPRQAVLGTKVWFQTDENVILATGRSDAHGTAMLDVPAGSTGRIWVAPPILKHGVSEVITVTDGGPREVHIAFAAHALSGTVVQDDGSPPPSGLPVLVEWDIRVPTEAGTDAGLRLVRVETDSSGAFVAQGIPAGPVRVRVRARDQSNPIGAATIDASGGACDIVVPLERVTMMVPTVIGLNGGKLEIDEVLFARERPDGTWARIDSAEQREHDASGVVSSWPPFGTVAVRGPLPLRVCAFAEGHAGGETVQLQPDERGRVEATFTLRPSSRRTGVVLTPRVTVGESPTALRVSWTAGSTGRTHQGMHELKRGQVLLLIGPGPRRLRLGRFHRGDESDQDWFHNAAEWNPDWFPEEHEVFIPPGELVEWPVSLRPAGGIVIATPVEIHAQRGGTTDEARFHSVVTAGRPEQEARPISPGAWTVEMTIDGVLRRGTVDVTQGVSTRVDPRDLPAVEAE